MTDENGVKIDCEAMEKAMEDDQTMGLNNLGGAFIVLVVGIFISLLFGLLEFLWAARQTSIDYKAISEVFCFSFEN